jgi:hypothetical protein
MFLTVLQFPPVIVVPPTPHSHIPLHDPATKGKTGEAWEPSKKAVLFQK